MTDRKSKPGREADSAKHPFGKFIKSDKTGKGESGESGPGNFRKKKADGEKPSRDFKKSSRDSDRKSSRGSDRPFRGEGSSRDFKKSSRDSDRPSRGEGSSRDFKKSSRDSDRPFRGKDSSRDFKKPSRDFKPASRGSAASADVPRKRHSDPQADAQEDKHKDEVTFSKTLEDKWATPPVSSRKPLAKKDAGSRETAPRKRKGHYVKENSFEKAYDAEGRKKFTGGQSSEGGTGQVEHEGAMPLNKYIAHCGVCSRRDAVGLIKDGKVQVNETVILEPGFKVNPSDAVSLQGKPLQLQLNLVYVLLNKPKGYITTTDDPKGRRTVMDLVSGTIDERVFPIGRLDRNTTGLLLLTNDGQLAQQLAHPKFEVRKLYMVTLDKSLTQAHFEAILKGLELEDGPAPVDELEYLDSKNEIGIQIHSGKNRIVRRIFESLGYVVEKLDRVVYAGLTKKNLARGKWRFLTQQEIINLKHFSK